MLCNTDNFHKENFSKLLFTTENIDELRAKHMKVVHDYIIPIAPSQKNADFGQINRDYEQFEHKGDSPQDRGEIAKDIEAPPTYHDALQMHVFGDISVYPSEDMSH